MIEQAMYYEIIVKSGSWYKIVDTETGEILSDKLQGLGNVHEKLDSDTELMERVEVLVNDAMDVDNP